MCSGRFGSSPAETLDYSVLYKSHDADRLVALVSVGCATEATVLHLICQWKGVVLSLIRNLSLKVLGGLSHSPTDGGSVVLIIPHSSK